ncbi:hypothetical protein [Mesorhizobium liriopis]|uniref:hypothetical protein n=1 Tax=Mesorhizobium liriopis TaxID=2953882 RepID=UPI00209272CF|nr:hypothetical protein [Mesorhizobium liriopis]
MVIRLVFESKGSQPLAASQHDKGCALRGFGSVEAVSVTSHEPEPAQILPCCLPTVPAFAMFQVFKTGDFPSQMRAESMEKETKPWRKRPAH